MLENQESSNSFTGGIKNSSAIFYDHQSSRIFSTDLNAVNDETAPDYAMLIIKRWKLVFFTTFLGYCLSWVALSFIPKQYESSSMVKLGSYAPPAEGPVGRQIQATTEKQDYLVSQVAMLKSNSLAKAVLKKNPLILENIVGSSKSIKSKDEGAIKKDLSANVLGSYLRNISYEMVAGTSLIKISATSKDPYLAEKISNAHAKEFILLIQSNLSKLAKTNLYYLEKRVKDVEKNYFEYERQALDYAKANSLAGSDVEQIRKTLIEKYQGLYSRLNDAILQRAKTEAEYRELRGSSNGAVRFDPNVSKEFTRISTLDTQIKGLKNAGSDYEEIMKELKAERESLYNALKDYNSRKAESTQLEFKAASEAESLLKKELQKTIDEERELYSKMIEFNSLQEKSKTSKEQLKQVQSRYDDAVLNAKNNQHIVMLVDKALVPTDPSKPNRGLFLGLGLLGSFVFGVFLTIALDSVDQTIGSVEDVAKSTSIPMLGMIPSFNQSKAYGYGYGEDVGELRKTINSISDSLTNILSIGDLRNSFSRLGSISKSVVDTPSPLVSSDDFRHNVSSDQTDLIKREGDTSEPLMHAPEIPIRENVITYTKQWSRLSESFNEVFITMQSIMGDKPSSILIASGDKGDGKSTIAANLAVSFANSGKRTILIDSDFRLPTMHRFFDFSENLVGLSDYLLGHVGPFDSLYKTQAANLSIIPVGTYVGAYSQIGSGKKFKELIELLSDQYDVILIDGPPILHVSDSLALSRIVDGVALVVRNGKTLRETAKWVVGRLNQVGGKVLGIVYNDVPNVHNFSRYTY